METVIVYHTPFLQFRSYRTYEEWKHKIPMWLWDKGYGSYRTYEEWKPEKLPFVSKSKIGSYRTYEEWKLELKNSFIPFL